MPDSKSKPRAEPQEQAPAEASYADADPRNPGEVANRAASVAAQKAAERRAAPAQDHSARDAAEQAEPPAAYIADEALFIGDPAEAGTAPARAANPGDPVLPADVWRHGWREQVHPPEGYQPAESSSEEE